MLKGILIQLKMLEWKTSHPDKAGGDGKNGRHQPDQASHLLSLGGCAQVLGSHRVHHSVVPAL